MSMAQFIKHKFVCSGRPSAFLSLVLKLMPRGLTPDNTPMKLVTSSTVVSGDDTLAHMRDKSAEVGWAEAVLEPSVEAKAGGVVESSSAA